MIEEPEKPEEELIIEEPIPFEGSADWEEMNQV